MRNDWRKGDELREAQDNAKTVERDALGIVTRMGCDLGHSCEAIEPASVGKRPDP
jgi:hypothetical protein